MSVANPTGGTGYARCALDLIDRIVGLLVILAMAAMVTVVAAQVGLRYMLNQSFDWADELSRLLFVRSIFLAIPLGIKRGAHVSIELLTRNRQAYPKTFSLCRSAGWSSTCCRSA
jgi:TRAP-type transport system small permease protein